MPIPYMGSKNKIAYRIFNIINEYTKDRKEDLLVDLFTGGFAISEVFIKKDWKTINNDMNEYVMALLEKTLEGLPDEVYNWVSREKFEDVIKNPNKYEDWYVGYIQCIWSFGNNQKGYMFGRDVEEEKKYLYNFTVNGRINNYIEKLLTKKYSNKISELSTVDKRNYAIYKVFNTMSKIDKRYENYSTYRKNAALQCLSRLFKFKNFIVKNKQNIKQIIKGSYNEVEIPKNAIVYCDPPYQGTAEYSEGGFNHKEFWDYVRKLSKTNKVFVSEYTAPVDFKAIYEFEKGSSLQGGSGKGTGTEKLFILRK